MMDEILIGLRDAAPLMLLATVIVFQAIRTAQKKRQVKAARHGMPIGMKPCPWCGEYVMSGTGMIAHMNDKHAR